VKIVIVGGGFAGVKTALEVSNKPGIEITLISMSQNFEYHGALYRSGTGHSPLEVVLPLRNIFKRSKNLTFIHDKFIDFDAKTKHVTTETSGSFEYDKLVLAMGNAVNYFGLEGMQQHSMSMDTIASTIRLRHELTDLFKKKSHATIAVVGAGASGVELAGELQHFAHLVAERYQKKACDVEVKLIEGADRVLPALLPKASAKAAKRLRKLGVKLMLKTKVNKCDEGQLCLDSGDIKADLIAWTAGSSPVSFYAERPKVFQLERGRVKVDSYLRPLGLENVYVLGDNAFTKYSGMAQTALHDAKFVARNILREKKGRKPVGYRVFHPIYVIPIGPRWAVLQTPHGIMSGYRGWLVRRRADLEIYKNFEPYKQALKTWRKGNKLAKF
jgi:NADH dehydrogenase